MPALKQLFGEVQRLSVLMAVIVWNVENKRFHI